MSSILIRKICPKCDTEFDAKRYRAQGKWFEQSFCSRRCANSRGPWSEEHKRKLSDAANSWFANLSREDRETFRDKTLAAIPTRKKTRKKNRLNSFLSKCKTEGIDPAERLGRKFNYDVLLPFEKLLTAQAIRKRIIIEQNGKCNSCKLDKWLGRPLPLELEHKDGNRRNNSRENLECLCPNCHSLTPTWRGRKNRGRTGMTKKVSVEGYPSIRQYLQSIGKAPKGSSYAWVRRKLANGQLKS